MKFVLPLGPATGAPIVSFGYTNYRGEVADRRVVPLHVWFGTTEYHPDPQWLLHALDLERGQPRDFAMRDMREPRHGDT